MPEGPLFKFIVDHAGEEFYLIRADGTLVYVNEAVVRSLGYPAERVLAMGLAGIDPEHTREQFEQRFEELKRGDRPPFETVHIAADGRRVPKEVTSVYLRVGDEEFVCGFARDISGHRRVVEELRALARQQAGLAHLSQLALAQTDFNGLLVEVAGAVARTLDVEFSQVLELLPDSKALLMRAGAGWHDRPAGPAVVEVGTQSQAGFTLHTREPVVTDDFATEKRFGLSPLLAEHGVISGATVVIPGTPRPFGVLGAFATRSRRFAAQDIHFLQAVASLLADAVRRAQTQAALRESEEKYRVLIDTTGTGAVVLDREGRVLDANLEYVRLTGHQTLEQIQGRSVTEWTVPSDRARNAAEVARCLATGTVRGFEIDYVQADGRTVPVEINAAVLEGADGLRIMSLCRDITARRQMETRLTEAEKLESIGRLAGGIAHEFNNILTVILGNANLLALEPGLTTPAREYLEQITRSTQRTAELTRQLLAFARKQPIKVQRLDAGRVIAETMTMLQRVVSPAIRLEVRGASDLPAVLGDPVLLAQVLLNLGINARDAMPEGGSLVLEAAAAGIGADEAVARRAAKAGRFVRISVHDTGAGIPPEVVPHLFEPFFTTKEVGKGTGLGLATAYGLVREHGGWIEVDSAVGRGSSFHVFLPAGDGPAPAEEPTPVPADVRGGHETILLVEDEPAVRAVVREALERRGYRVLEAVDGREALRVWPARRDEIDLLLTDLVMPSGLGGEDLAARLQAERPGLRVLLSSGYSLHEPAPAAPPSGRARFISKPYDLSALARAVRDCLDNA